MAEDPKILFVEDNRDELDVALRALRRAGVHEPLTVARDGQEALEILGIEGPPGGEGTIKPRVIFLDLKMPRVDGWEVLRRIRENRHTATLPVVILSASDRSEDIQRCYELGANSFLLKHFDPRSPGAYIVEVVRYWLGLNRLAR